MHASDLGLLYVHFGNTLHYRCLNSKISLDDLYKYSQLPNLSSIQPWVLSLLFLNDLLNCYLFSQVLPVESGP